MLGLTSALVTFGDARRSEREAKYRARAVAELTKSVFRDMQGLPASGRNEALSREVLLAYFRSSSHEYATRDSLLKEVEALKHEYASRFSKLEDRLPRESTLDKLASVNDAILGTTVDNIAKRLDKIEARQLDRWDVAVVVTTVIGVLAAIVSIIVAIIKLASAKRASASGVASAEDTETQERPS